MLRWRRLVLVRRWPGWVLRVSRVVPGSGSSC